MPQFLSRKATALLLVGLSACTSASKVKSISQLEGEKEISTDVEITSEYLEAFNTLPLAGSNFLSDYSVAGDRFLFFSSNRISHKKFQVYEYDFNKKEERRITHQNGHAFHASYHPNGQHVIYASTTDFEKENLSNLFQIEESNSDLAFQAVIPELKSDLFISRMNGTNIIRATYLDSAEQFPIYHPKDYTIIYKLTRGNSSSIERMTRYRKPLAPLSLRNQNHSFLNISDSGKNLAWIQYDEELGFFLHKMDWKSKKQESLKIKGVLSVSSLAWYGEKNLLLTARFEDDDVPQAYMLASDLSCISKLGESQYGIQNLMGKPGKPILMSAFTGTHWQIITAKWKKVPNCETVTAKET